MSPIAGEAVVRKSVRVPVTVERAFTVFVESMETWWPAAHHIGAQPFETIIVEPRTGGRWYEKDAQGNHCNWGSVLAWEPPHRVVFSWHLGPDWKFNPDLAKASEVEIRFRADGPAATLVELEHSHFERHGEGYEQIRTAVDTPDGWSLTLAEFARAVQP